MALFDKHKKNTSKIVEKVSQSSFDDFFNCDISELKIQDDESKPVVSVNTSSEKIGEALVITEEAVLKATSEFNEKLNREREQRQRVEQRMKEKREAEKQRKASAISTYEVDKEIEELVEEAEIEKKLVSLEKSYQVIKENREAYHENLIGIENKDLETAKTSFDKYCDNRSTVLPPHNIADASTSGYEEEIKKLEGGPAEDFETQFVSIVADNVEEYFEGIEISFDEKITDSIEVI